jgi:hypothetical protein
LLHPLQPFELLGYQAAQVLLDQRGQRRTAVGGDPKRSPVCLVVQWYFDVAHLTRVSPRPAAANKRLWGCAAPLECPTKGLMPAQAGIHPAAAGAVEKWILTSPGT